MSTKAIVAMIIVATLFARLSNAGKIKLYDYDYRSGELLNKETLDICPAQRCHSYSKFGHSVAVANWTDLQQNALLVFYNGFGCQGRYLQALAGEDGGMDFRGSELEDHIYSVMLWESSIYPTRGIVDKTFPYAWMAYYYESTKSISGGGDNATSRRDDDEVGEVAPVVSSSQQRRLVDSI